jgi:hypothetical protein
MQISAACHHCNVCLRQSCDRNQCAQHTQRQAKVTDKRTDGRTDYSSATPVSMPSTEPGCYPQEERTKFEFASAARHKGQQDNFLRILLCFGKTFKKENPPQCLKYGDFNVFLLKMWRIKKRQRTILSVHVIKDSKTIFLESCYVLAKPSRKKTHPSV